MNKKIYKILNVTSVAFAILFGVLYIFEINKGATLGYQFREVEDGIEKLNLEKQRIETDLAKNQSIEAVSERVKMLGMVPVKDVHYVTGSAPSVAINR